MDVKIKLQLNGSLSLSLTLLFKRLDRYDSESTRFTNETHIQRYMKGWWVVVMLSESPSSDLNLKEKGMKKIVHVIIK